MELGAGREHKDSVIDLAVGIELKAEIGDYVEAGMPLATIYANDPHKLREAAGKALQAFQIGDGKPALKPTIYRKITAEQL
jgi:pyrimidine-nucleoside phosphorylase